MFGQPDMPLIVLQKMRINPSARLGPDIVWLHSYVTENKIYCVYKAKDEKIIREHASKGGFPVTSITKLSTIISPETAN